MLGRHSTRHLAYALTVASPVSRKVFVGQSKRLSLRLLQQELSTSLKCNFLSSSSSY